MRAVSNSWTRTWRRYLASRLPLRLYMPCAVLLVVAGLAGGRALAPTQLALLIPLAFGLLLQFRVLDDISDLPHDRRVHPDRVLVQTGSLAPSAALFAASCLLNLVLLALQTGPAYRLGVFLLLTGTYLLWYCALRSMLTNEIIGYHIVAGKYAAFVFLLSGEGESTWNLVLTMALVYVSFTIHEVLHDRALQAVPGAELALRLEIGFLFVVSALMALELSSRSLVVAAVQGLLGLVSLLTLGEAFGRRRIHCQSAKAGYLVFAVAFALSVAFALGARL